MTVSGEHGRNSSSLGIGFAMGVERFMLEANSQGVDFGKQIM